VTPRLVAGLCSVTFRQLPADDVIDLAADAGLASIEWGADVHVTPGDIAEAARVHDRCAAHGLTCPSYGSYYFAGASSDDELTPVLETARALGATTVRVWAPGDPRPDRWDAATPVIDALRRGCDAAATHDLTLALEFHPGTLTETARSTREVLAGVDRTNLRTYWQPTPGATRLHALTELDPVVRHLEHLHVFSWAPDSSRLALDAHADLWRHALRKVADEVAEQDDRVHVAYLEFVPGDAPDAFRRDAAVLRTWLDELA
jgi:sugar phosphate isomerase/epimerase